MTVQKMIKVYNLQSDNPLLFYSGMINMNLRIDNKDEYILLDIYSSLI